MMRFLILLLALPAAADIQKCVSGTGEIIYQDRPCPHPEMARDINRKYANELPVAPPAAEQEAMARITEAREDRTSRNVRRRNAEILEYSRRHKERKDKCARLKQDYNALVISKRRNGRPGGNHESRLIKEMREACSGWIGD